MKSVLMALILVSSVAAQARVIMQVNQSNPIPKTIQKINLDRVGSVVLVIGTEMIVIPKAVIQSTGLTTKEFIDYVNVYNADSSKHLTISLRDGNYSQINQMNLSFSQ